MDPRLRCTVVGSVAGVMTVPTAVVIGVFHLRQAGENGDDGGSEPRGESGGVLPPRVRRRAALFRQADQLRDGFTR